MSAETDLRARFDDDAKIKANVDRLLAFVDDPDDREELRRIGQRAICNGGADDGGD